MKANGFNLIKSSYLEDLAGEIHLYEHEKSGARLWLIPNDDKHKMFALGFATHPDSDNGVFHVLEHCLLQGSERFPVKGLFLELLKGSMNTFLNAMTLADTTVYAVASKNDKDFMNLVQVYLDSVFQPLVLKSPYAFYQEGIRLEWDEEGRPYFNGIVFNEMKGAKASPESRAISLANRALFDNLYRYDSGGSPLAIADLSYEDLVLAYKGYYNPSNARFFLYGDARAEEIMAYLDREYLSRAEAGPSYYAPDLEPTEGFSPQYLRDHYGGGEDRIFSWHFVLGESKDKAKAIFLAVLFHVLWNQEASSLRQGLIQKDFCYDLYAGLDTSKTPLLSNLFFYGVGEDSAEGLEATLLEAVGKIDLPALKEELLDFLAHYQESLQDPDSGQPKGWKCCQEILFHLEAEPEDTLARLKEKEAFDQVRQWIVSGDFVAMAEELLVKNPRRAGILLAPSGELEVEDYQEEMALAQKRSQALNREAWEKELEAFYDWQAEGNSKEALASIPRLKREDLAFTEELKEVKVYEEEGLCFLHYPWEKAQSSYAKIYFELPPDQGLFHIGVLCSLWGALDLKDLPLADLARQVHKQQVSLSFSPAHIDGKNYLVCYIKSSREAFDKALELAASILAQTRFDSPEDLEPLLFSSYLQLQMELQENGSFYAVEEAAASLDRDSLHSSQSSGIRHYFRLKALLESEDLRPVIEKFALELETTVHRALISNDRLTFAILGQEADLARMKSQSRTFMKRLAAAGKAQGQEGEKDLSLFQEAERGSELSPEAKKAYNPSSLAERPGDFGRRLGLQIAHDVGFVAGAALLPGPFSGRRRVLASLLTNDYLLPEVRVKAGAYGVSANVRQSGLIVFSSFRDNECKKTLETYRKAADYLLDLRLGEDQLLAHIIGTLSQYDHYESEEDRAWDFVNRRLGGLSSADWLKERKEILATSLDDLKELARALREALVASPFCAISPESHLAELKADLDDLRVI